jgi:hypothetical protein
VSEPFDLAAVVAHEDGAAPRQHLVLDQFLDEGGRLGIERAGGLVQQ